MTTEPVSLDALLEARAQLFQELPAALDQNERQLLRTLARAEPDWSLLEIPHLELLPAVRWKLQKLEKLARTMAAAGNGKAPIRSRVTFRTLAGE